MRCTQTVEAGAYVLGALAPADRSFYERHVTDCPTCRDEVAELAGLPGLLGRLDADTASAIGEPICAPPDILDSVLAEVRSERSRLRRRHRWERGTALLAAACLIVLSIVGVETLDRHPAPRPIVAAMTPAENDEPVTAALMYWPKSGGGTEIEMDCAYPPPSTPYVGGAWTLTLVVFARGSDTGDTVSTWDAGPGTKIKVHGQSAVPPAQIGRIEVRHGTETLLVYEAA